LEPQGITHIVEPEGVADLGVEHRHHVAPGTEGAGLLNDRGLAGQLRDKVGWNEFDELPQDRSVPTARLLGFFVFHTLPNGR
jgi:hypothetical protein